MIRWLKSLFAGPARYKLLCWWCATQWPPRAGPLVWVPSACGGCNRCGRYGALMAQQVKR